MSKVEVEILEDETPIIVVYPRPLYLMSPGIEIYRAEDIKRYRGYLKTFIPEGMTEGMTVMDAFSVTVVLESKEPPDA